MQMNILKNTFVINVKQKYNDEDND